jgi:hypothetical protein
VGINSAKSIIRKDKITNNNAYFVRKGEILGLSGSLTGSYNVSVDSYVVKLKRFQIFHSGSSPLFDVIIESNGFTTPDPRNYLAEYKSISGSDNYTGGIDQVEDLVGITSGHMNLKVMPHNSGSNDFKFLIFFEPALIIEG